MGRDDRQTTTLYPLWKDAIMAKKKRALKAKKGAVALRKSDDLSKAQQKKDLDAAQLAQIANLVISGMTFEQIGNSIGATADEVERMLDNGAERFIRNQPSLRVFTRNYVTKKYSELLSASWAMATDATHVDFLAAQNSAIKVLERMARLHGAEAPTQTEVAVTHAPETVEKMVERLAKKSGLAYDIDIFSDLTIDLDVVDAELVEDIVETAGDELEVSGNQVGQDQDGDGAL